MKHFDHLILSTFILLSFVACGDSTPIVPEHINHEHEDATEEHSNETTSTIIAPEFAHSLGITTELVGPQTIENTVQVYGRIVNNTESIRNISARFDGRIKDVYVQLGERVKAGAKLATIESNQSLTDFDIVAPISGIILSRNAGSGEQSAGRELFSIMDDSTVWVDLALFPQVRAQVREGTLVQIETAFSATPVTSSIDRFLPVLQSNQSTTARLTLPNPEGTLQPGTWVEASIHIGERDVALAVRREAIQTFRDFDVVFAKMGDEYEVRMLELGAQSQEWVEVLGGISAGTLYVTQNSYIIKADIEKAGASHDH